jgi:hypothetical protein
VWDYDDTRRIQRLVRLVALCPPCHEVKHLGLTAKRGRQAQALAHLARVNSWTRADAEAYAEVVFEQWATRSRHHWTLDCTVLEAQGVRFEPTLPARRTASRTCCAAMRVGPGSTLRRLRGPPGASVPVPVVVAAGLEDLVLGVEETEGIRVTKSRLWALAHLLLLETAGRAGPTAQRRSTCRAWGRRFP